MRVIIDHYVLMFPGIRPASTSRVFSGPFRVLEWKECAAHLIAVVLIALGTFHEDLLARPLNNQLHGRSACSKA